TRRFTGSAVRGSCQSWQYVRARAREGKAQPSFAGGRDGNPRRCSLCSLGHKEGVVGQAFPEAQMRLVGGAVVCALALLAAGCGGGGAPGRGGGDPAIALFRDGFKAPLIDSSGKT